MALWWLWHVTTELWSRVGLVDKIPLLMNLFYMLLLYFTVLNILLIHQSQWHMS
jgi:hypothetical protein